MASTTTTSLAPRPKPWEQAAATADGESSALHHAAGGSSSDPAAPMLPERPGDMNGLITTGGGEGFNAIAGPSYTQPYSAYGTGAGAYGGGVGSYGGVGGGYGGMGGAYGGAYGGGYGSYSSPYSRLGGYGGGYGIGGGYGLGGMGVPGEPYGPPTLSSSLQQTTRPAFQLIESLVGAVTSLAHLLESTYVATHSSFFAMVSVADQLGGLKTYLGQVLGVFSVLRLARKLISWLKGGGGSGGAEARRRGAGAGSGWADEWVTGIGKASALPGQATGPLVAPQTPRPSSKPLILFLLSAVGLPYLMSKLVRMLTAIQEAQAREAAAAIGPGGVPQGQPGAPGAATLNTADIPKGPITFARALYPFTATSAHELSLKRDEIVAILQRYQGSAAEQADGKGAEMGWWRGRTRDGRVGWFPGNYVEILRKKETKAPDTPEGGSERGHPGSTGSSMA